MSAAEGADPREIARFERMGFATWPALEVHAIGGWQLRLAGGVSGRANSVQVFESDPVTLEQVDVRIAHCEAFYRQRRLPVRFKLTEAVQPPDLDARLAARGYRRVSPTRVQVLRFRSESAPGSAAASEFDSSERGEAGDKRPVGDGLRVVADTRDARWRCANNRLNAVPEASRTVLDAMHARIDRPFCATLEQAGRDVAVGLGALASGWLFLGQVATEAGLRRRGHARVLVEALLERGRRAQALGAWLQVVDGNEPALALYHGLGFRDCYGYWYRVRE